MSRRKRKEAALTVGASSIQPAFTVITPSDYPKSPRTYTVSAGGISITGLDPWECLTGLNHRLEEELAAVKAAHNYIKGLVAVITERPVR